MNAIVGTKLVGHLAIYPFVASLVLNDDHAEVLLYIFLGPSRLALSVALSFPFPEPLRADFKSPSPGLPTTGLAFDLASIAKHAADANPQVTARQETSDVDSLAPAATEEFLTLAPTSADTTNDTAAAAALLEVSNGGVALHAPKLVAEGEGGTYFVHDTSGAAIGVFKPTDEDPQADNNPKRRKTGDAESLAPVAGRTEEVPAVLDEEEQQRTRRSIPVNGAAVREAAAYAIDRGYSGVPPTFLVQARHPSFGNAEEAKLGSLQQFVPNECASWDVGPAAFSVADVHKIGIFDIRTFNTDRHGGNLLCKKTAHPQGKVQYDLVPIDHGYCFPTDVSEANWEWLYWPQAKVPFTEDELRYIDSIDVNADAELLTRLGLDPEAVRVYRTTTTFLKKGAAAGLTLFELGKMCYRGRDNALSPLEVALSANNCNVAADADADQCRAADLRLSCALDKLCQRDGGLYNTTTVIISGRTQVSRG